MFKNINNNLTFFNINNDYNNFYLILIYKKNFIDLLKNNFIIIISKDERRK